MREIGYPRLNFPSVRLRARQQNGCNYVWDDLRGRWLLLTPEEWVRRHVIGFLLDEQAVLPVNLIQEFPVCVEGMPQRADVVVTDNGQRPLMLVECKCADVKIDGSVLAQAVRYNSVVGARYVMLTNGLRHYFYETGDGINYSQLESVPALG